MTSALSWSKGTHVKVIDDNTIAIITEDNENVLVRPCIGHIARLISQGQYHDFTNPNVQLLFAQKWIEYSSPSSTAALDKNLWQAQINNLLKDSNITVFYNDNLYSEALERHNKQHLLEGKDWLLIGNYGNTLQIGPWFSPTKHKGCWQCLKTRLEWNSPLRFWLHKSHNEQLSDTKTHYQLTPSQLSTVKQLIEKLQQSDTLTFYTLALNHADINQHQVIVRPQCHVCGNPDLFKLQQLAKFELSAESKKNFVDGGFRTVAPESTIAKVLKTLDQRSGIINYINNSPNQEQSTNEHFIYRCVFHKSPYIKENIKQTDFIQVTVGKGMSRSQSQASALAEAIERLSANYQGDEVCILEKASSLTTRHYLPTQLAPFSLAQFLKFKQAPDDHRYQLYSTEEFDINLRIHWSPAWSLTAKEHVYLPSNYCFDNTPFINETCTRYYQNGCAAGNTLEEALLQGILEIIERDAIAVWWYNQIPRAEVTISHLPDLVDKASQILGELWQYWVLDICNDFLIPTYAAIARNSETGEFSFGFGCHLDPDIALKRAMTELFQMLDIKDSTSAPFDFNDIKEHPFLFPSDVAINLSTENTSSNTSSLQSCIDSLLTRAQSLNLEVLFINTSRADFPLKAVKVIIPGMCHIFPFLAAERLYQVPKRLGMLDKIKNEGELNPLELLI
ncbi:TOMM precursor leader peptide-binding protein [Thalassomonas sp. RHCl1]|uniref:TOMM precursor leader peptide-binding protein n=1 Tax=Thalassomonas sp. RHCl1 TaxID=2995320 RepID=UPI00248C94C2|nr:TOMM precursor leader peptide-binding protein [Thalassomonas sp. RHCl1]